jgi:hypothetical protein
MVKWSNFFTTMGENTSNVYTITRSAATIVDYETK